MEPPYDGFTRAPGQHPDVFPSSPNGVMGVFVTALQARFYPPVNNDNALPWVWRPDPTPEGDDVGPSEGEAPGRTSEPRRLYIGEADVEYPTARNTLPGLLVGRGPINFVSLGAGNTVEHDYPRGGEVLVFHAKVPVVVECVSREKAEAETIGDVVATFLIASAKELRSAFGIHDIGLPSVSPASIYKRTQGNADAWSVQVALPTEVQYKFWRWPLAPVFNAIRASLEENGQVTSLAEVLQRRSTP